MGLIVIESLVVYAHHQALLNVLIYVMNWKKHRYRMLPDYVSVTTLKTVIGQRKV